MPAHESLHEYYLHQHRNIENYLELCMIHAEAELVHELRLSIKKIRAFHKLAEELCPSGMDEHIHIKNRVGRLFRIAGQLRDTQVQIHLLVMFEQQTGLEYPEFSKWLLKREKKRIKRFGRKPQHLLSQATSDTSLKGFGDWLALASDETILTGADKVLTGLCSSARELTAGSINERDLHLIRTLTKQVKYILNIMRHSYPDFKFTEISVDSLHKIEISAGNWHDNLVRIELLERCMEKLRTKDDSDMFQYQKLFNSCKAELNIAYSETCRIVKNELLPGENN